MKLLIIKAEEIKVVLLTKFELSSKLEQENIC